jgi:hypothetical protein
MNQREFVILKEKLEILAGERGAPVRFALRRGDLARLPELVSREVSGTPTADDFNALRKDLEMIRQALVALGENGVRGR